MHLVHRLVSKGSLLNVIPVEELLSYPNLIETYGYGVRLSLDQLHLLRRLPHLRRLCICLTGITDLDACIGTIISTISRADQDWKIYIEGDKPAILFMHGTYIWCSKIIHNVCRSKGSIAPTPLFDMLSEAKSVLDPIGSEIADIIIKHRALFSYDDLAYLLVHCRKSGLLTKYLRGYVADALVAHRRRYDDKYLEDIRYLLTMLSPRYWKFELIEYYRMPATVPYTLGEFNMYKLYLPRLEQTKKEMLAAMAMVDMA